MLQPENERKINEKMERPVPRYCCWNWYKVHSQMMKKKVRMCVQYFLKQHILIALYPIRYTWSSFNLQPK
jgi:hypothetical protein